MGRRSGPPALLCRSRKASYSSRPVNRGGMVSTTVAVLALSSSFFSTVSKGTGAQSVAHRAAPMAAKQSPSSGKTAWSPSSFSVSTNRWRRPIRKWRGPPRKTILPFSSRPWVRPATVWSTTAWKMEAATSSFRPPWFRMG